MKGSILGILLITASFSFAQENEGLGRVKKMSGIELYILF
jgi:hypothetical protein